MTVSVQSVYSVVVVVQPVAGLSPQSDVQPPAGAPAVEPQLGAESHY